MAEFRVDVIRTDMCELLSDAQSVREILPENDTEIKTFRAIFAARSTSHERLIERHLDLARPVASRARSLCGCRRY